MPGLLLLIFIATPLLEIAVFIQAGSLIGLWPTVATVVLTALIGTALLRQQGLATLARAQQNMAQGEMPVGELFEGLCLLVAGALLLTPGFVTDAIGFCLLVPPVRKALGTALLQRIMRSGSIHTSFRGGGFKGGFSSDQQSPFGNGGRSGSHPSPDAKADAAKVIDVEYEDVPPKDPKSGY